MGRGERSLAERKRERGGPLVREECLCLCVSSEYDFRDQLPVTKFVSQSEITAEA